MAVPQRPLNDARVVRTITIRAAKYELLDDGIIRASPTEADVDLANAREMMDTLYELAPHDRPVRMLLDERSVARRILPDGRRHMNSRADKIDRMAILVGNTISRFFATGMLVVAGLGERIKVFDNEAAAYAWLREGF